jgi:hypothetical protein
MLELECGTFQFLPLSLFCLENHVCLYHGVQVTGATWLAAMRIITGVGDLAQRTENDRTGRVLGGWMIRRSSDAICDLHRACGDKECRFLS